MQSRCPYYDCFKLLDVDTSEPPDLMRPERGTCPFCKRPASLRAVEILERCDKVWQQKNGDHDARRWDTSEYSTLLEDIRSLGNVGSIFRTADGAGIQRIYLSGFTGCPPRKQIAKTSLGAEDEIPWHYVAGAGQILPHLKEKGIAVVGLERNPQSLEVSQAVALGKIQPPFCLVVGNEVTGLSEEALYFCDVVCHLPMRGMKESLNVAVAFGIAAYIMLAER